MFRLNLICTLVILNYLKINSISSHAKVEMSICSRTSCFVQSKWDFKNIYVIVYRKNKLKCSYV
uniref:Uncharacterized protein n=1 Tax=Arundo donax TaxID=35708 RepID=A0A0A8Y9K1_ARUDO